MLGIPRCMSLVLSTQCDCLCRHCLVRNRYQGQLDQCLAIDLLAQFARLGGVYVDFTGGDPLLYPALARLIKESNKLGLVSSLTVAGKSIDRRLADVVELPSILRFSLDGVENRHDNNRGIGSYAALVGGLELVDSVGRKNVHLIMTLFPGLDGNINQEELADCLRLARRFKVMINVNPLFGLHHLTAKEWRLIRWLGRQADVQCSLGKLRFMGHGGNNTLHPTCRAVHEMITIAPDGKLILPCIYHHTVDISLESGLAPAIESPGYQKMRKSDGKHACCQGCTAWCYIIPSILARPIDRFVFWLDSLSRLQRARDSLLKICGRIHLNDPYPDFTLP